MTQQLDSHIQGISVAAEVRLRDELQLFQNRSHHRNEQKYPVEVLPDGRYPPESHQVVHNDIHRRHSDRADRDESL